VAVYFCMFSSGSRDQLCSSPAVLHWSWVFTGLDYWGLVSLPCPFPWVKVSDLSAGLLLSACCHGLLIIFQFCSVVWLWVLFTSSGDKLCGPLPALFQAATYHPPIVTLLPFQPLFSESSHGDQLLAFPLLRCTFSNSTSSAVCLFSVCCLLFGFFVCFFFCWGGSVCPGGYAGLSQGWLGEYCVTLGVHPSGLLNVSQVGLDQGLVASGTLLFSQCNVAWRSFLWARGSVCRSFDSSWCFISAKCGSSISARFLIHGAHSVCFCTLVAILEPLCALIILNIKLFIVSIWSESKKLIKKTEIEGI
jgi:hypothetical protein